MYKVKANMDTQLEACGRGLFYTLRPLVTDDAPAANQNHPRDAFIAAEGLDAETGMKTVSEAFREKGGDIYRRVE